MIFKGETTVKLTSVTLTDLRGKDRKCAECGQHFEPDDLVVIFSTGRFREDSEGRGEVTVGDDLELVHVGRRGSLPGSCLEDFVAKRLQTMEPKFDTDIVPVAAVIGPAEATPPA